LELVHYLLKIKDERQAQSELIALAANVGNDAGRQAQLGDLFLEAQDYRDALNAYRLSFKTSPRRPAALAGAGRAAFELHLYTDAEQYLESAMAAGSRDSDLALKLKTAGLVLRMDPFRRRYSVEERSRIVMEDFAAAGEHLESCAAAAGSGSAAGAAQELNESWTRMRPEITVRGLRRNPDLSESAMELAFNIERQTSAMCAPTATDTALLLIAKLHEGN
jgi:tetratricopeptide (TPR) repeat protein